MTAPIKKITGQLVILPNLSKVFEKCIYKQLSKIFENLFSKYQCGFREGLKEQPCLIKLIDRNGESV